MHTAVSSTMTWQRRKYCWRNTMLVACGNRNGCNIQGAACCFIRNPQPNIPRTCPFGARHLYPHEGCEAAVGAACRGTAAAAAAAAAVEAAVRDKGRVHNDCAVRRWLRCGHAWMPHAHVRHGNKRRVAGRQSNDACH